MAPDPNVTDQLGLHVGYIQRRARFAVTHEVSGDAAVAHGRLTLPRS